MSSAFGNAVRLLILGGLGIPAAMAAESGDAARPIDFSVLTPAIQGRYFVTAQTDLSALLPPYMEVVKLAASGRSKQLRALVAREGYDPTRAIADRVIEALAASAYRAVYEPIPREPAGSLQTLSWDELPQAPQGELMLDLTVQWIGLCADVALSDHYPAVSISWRLLHPAQEVVEPTRTLTYHHFPAWYSGRRAKAAAADGAPGGSPHPPGNVAGTCGFDSVKATEGNPAALWACLDEAYAAAARRLVLDLARVHPPRAPPTASGGTPSGISTR